VEAIVALEVRDGAAKMRADSAGYSESLIAIAKDEDLLLDQERGGAKGEVGGIAYLEGLRRLIENAWHQEL
jgi:hypothetical protein